MCLIVKDCRKKATEDITCYKVLLNYNDSLASPCTFGDIHNHTCWNVGETKTDTNKGKRNKNMVEGGYFHSFNTIESAMRMVLDFPSAPLKIFKAIIPQGTLYYEGVCFGCDLGYASKSLRIDKQIY